MLPDRTGPVGNFSKMKSTIGTSSADQGFFQSLPTIPPQYDSIPHRSQSTSRDSWHGSDDAMLDRIVKLYLPTSLPISATKHLNDVARTCLSPTVLQLQVDAEVNQPTLQPRHTFGQLNRVDALRTSPGWKGLKDIGITIGSVALGYAPAYRETEGHLNRRVNQFLVNHLWGGSAALTTCPAAMTDGAATLLGRHTNDIDGDQPGRRAVFLEARNRLMSSDPDYAWTSGQWMTERTGGSDVSGTETTAVRVNAAAAEVTDRFEQTSDSDAAGMPLGPWEISGFKWFSSATDADMVVLLARTDKGISAFYAPLRKQMGSSSVMNGVTITRLKNKLGTKALPTAELEIKGMRAWLIGEEGKGIKEISAVLNTTRLWTACGSVAGWARSLAISRAYSRARKVGGKLLIENAQHVRWMAQETMKYRAAAGLAFLGAALSGVAEQGNLAVHGTAARDFLPAQEAEAQTLLRALTPVMKAQCSLASVAGVRNCMESLGGAGYCENNEDNGILNVARLFRDVNVNPIWEGTVSVMAEDVVRVFKGRTQAATITALDRLLDRALDRASDSMATECALVRTAWSTLAHKVQTSTQDMLLYDGRHILRELESIFCACVLVADASIDQDEVSMTVAKRWIAYRFLSDYERSPLNYEKEHVLDQQIFLGQTPTDRSGLRAHM